MHRQWRPRTCRAAVSPERLGRLSVNALALGGMDPKDAQERLRAFPWNGGPGFIFTSPEKAETDGYLEHLLRGHKSRVTLVAVDEPRPCGNCSISSSRAGWLIITDNCA
jgi:hypothetical protein